jgi:hypothetical protein
MTRTAQRRRQRAEVGHVLVIEGWHPCRLNQLVGCHWGTRSKRKRLDREVIALEALVQKIPKALGKRRISLVLTLAPRQRAGDPDSAWKSLLDALVAAGLLVNDSHLWCELGEVRFERGKAQRTVIVLTDLAGSGRASPGG